MSNRDCVFCGTRHVSEPDGDLCRMRQRRRAEAQATASDQRSLTLEEAPESGSEPQQPGPARKHKLEPVAGCTCGYHTVAFTYDEHVVLAGLAMGEQISERDDDIVPLLFRAHLVNVCGQEPILMTRGLSETCRTFEINNRGREVARCGRQPIMSRWIESHCSGELAERARRAAEEAARALDQQEAKAHARRIATGPSSTPAGWVYAYGYPRDLVLAEADPAQSRIKVGCTTRSPAERMREQVTTSSPEAPILLGQWPAPPGMSAAVYEAKVHAILDRHGLRLRSGGGTEWFAATLDQVEAAARYAAAFA